MRRRAPEATDWLQIAALYDVLLRLDDDPVVAPNHAVAISMVAGPPAGLELVQRLGTDPRLNADRRFCAVRGHLHRGLSSRWSHLIGVVTPCQRGHTM
jgi:predicted RNA polymerase sigma factor